MKYIYKFMLFLFLLIFILCIPLFASKQCLSNTDKFINTLKEMNQDMLFDLKSGRQWVYSNGSIPKANNFDEARLSGKLAINCVDGIHWALIKSGVINNDYMATKWYGGENCIVWLDENAEEIANKYFNIFYVGNKTVFECINDGTLISGDILTYVDIIHTNCYLGDYISFDSGHAYCDAKNGDGAKFEKWIGKIVYGDYKVAYVLRLKK